MKNSTVPTHIYIVQIIAIIAALALTGCKKSVYERVDGFAQGSTFHLVYNTPDNGAQYNVADSLTKYFSLIDKSLSGYDSTSIVSKINRGENPPLDSLFIECFNLSKMVYEETGGAFDISAAPLFDIWGFGFKNGEEIHRDKIDSIKQFVGMDKLSIIYDSTTNAHFLHREDERMRVNFNAIAQGYTCDFIGRELEKMGISNYLLEVGGEIFCKGRNAKGRDWSIGIDKPVDGNFIPGESIETIIEVTDRGLVTSGNYRKFYIKDGEKFSHTIDPLSGEPVKHNLLSATVVASSAAIADAYATYLMVIGVERAIDFVGERGDMEALLVYGEQDDMKVYASGGIKQRTLKK